MCSEIDYALGQSDSVPDPPEKCKHSHPGSTLFRGPIGGPRDFDSVSDFILLLSSSVVTLISEACNKMDQ